MSSARESVRGGTLKKATVTQWLSERQRQERRPRLGSGRGCRGHPSSSDLKQVSRGRPT